MGRQQKMVVFWTYSHDLVISHHEGLLGEILRGPLGTHVDEFRRFWGGRIGFADCFQSSDSTGLAYAFDLGEIKLASSEWRDCDGPVIEGSLVSQPASQPASRISRRYVTAQNRI
jgi:hypothetical protein